MKYAIALIVAWTIAGAAGTTAARAQSSRNASPSPDLSAHKAVLQQYCMGCHNSRTRTADLALDTVDLNDAAAHPEIWEKVVRKLRTGAMPPAGMPRPSDTTYESLASGLEAALDAAAVARPQPGAPWLHRLNRSEYTNAVRDLLALDIDAASLLPADDAAAGFDNNAGLLGVSPTLLERYLSAAAKISALAVGDATLLGPTSQTYVVRGDVSQDAHIDGLPLGTRGGVAAHHTFPLNGQYVVQAELLQTNLGAVRGLLEPHVIEFSVDGARVFQTTVGGDADNAMSAANAADIIKSLDERLTTRVTIGAGPHVIAAAFLKRTSAQGGSKIQPFLRTTLDAGDHTGLPHVASLTIIGPFDATGAGDTPSRRKIFACRPATASDLACANKILFTLGSHAYRRPMTRAETDRLMTLYREGRQQGTFETGIEFGLRGILANPKFVFRAERDPINVAPGSTYRIDDYELASRLSFFLWSSIPDEELTVLAGRGRLREPAVLEAQMRRMLADRRAESLVTNFAGQWLQLRNLRSSLPDKEVFPDFDDNLRQSFQRETELFFDSIIREDRSVVDLLTADYTFVDERLAKHYGIPGVYGSHFRRVTLANEARRGLLGQGSILTVTSHGNRTSPVVRGKWVLDNLLGAPPPPPPPNVPPLDEDQGNTPKSMRERMEQHRRNSACANCHKIMDPIGLALENFDAIGAWRTFDGSTPIDASGQLSDGSAIDGPVALRNALLRRRDVFVHTVTEKLLTYALGRSLDFNDMPTVRTIARQSAAQDNRWSSLVMGIVMSPPFQMRTAPSSPVTATARK